eukprot:TRINITY_DN30889_c0_g1_i1.p1 TRINITY_DN30889_c0_g1~~TRINITY_DN30889_c0_g1_i1.p1  ORF type:complete len:339 (-),score=59.08 TRINITY_DN30889_c0_g1_i1:91-1068(-)
MAVEKVQRWYLENGGSALPAGVVIRESPLGGNGIFLEDGSDVLPAETEVLSLPFEACLSSEDSAVNELPVNTLFRLCELLCSEIVKGSNSRWAAWFESLPKQCGSWPEWRDDEFRSVQKGPHFFFEDVVKTAQNLPAWYKQISETLPSSAIASLDDKAPFRRSLAVLYSRRFGFNRKGAKVAFCVPLGDMANHSGMAANVEVRFDEAADRVCFMTTREIHAGEEFFICYGNYDNFELCTSHGFVLPGNLLDKVTLPDGVKASRGIAQPPSSIDALQSLIASLPPAKEDEEVLASSTSSAGCRAISQWRLDHRTFLEELVKISTEG